MTKMDDDLKKQRPSIYLLEQVDNDESIARRKYLIDRYNKNIVIFDSVENIFNVMGPELSKHKPYVIVVGSMKPDAESRNNVAELTQKARIESIPIVVTDHTVSKKNGIFLNAKGEFKDEYEYIPLAERVKQLMPKGTCIFNSKDPDDLIQKIQVASISGKSGRKLI